MITRLEKNKEKQNEITEAEKREKIKKGVILGIKITISLILLFTGIYFYTTECATKWLIVKEERIINEKIPTSFDSVKIIHFSDLHYGNLILKNEVKSLVKKINSRNPDIVVFTGDLIDPNYDISNEEKEELITILKGINSNIGKYAVNGDNDDEDSFQTIMNQSDFTTLNNDYDLVYSSDNNPILLVGLNSLNKQTRNIDNAYRYFKEETHNSNIYTILLMHETDDIDEILTLYPTDLILAGHSLNGQINVPGIGPLIKKEGSEQYDEAYYEKDSTKIYVSSGIGTDGIGFRIFARPSINFFRLSTS